VLPGARGASLLSVAALNWRIAVGTQITLRLSAREVPASGGETEFADLRAAYDALEPVRRAQIEGLAEHSIFHSRSLIGYTDF